MKVPDYSKFYQSLFRQTGFGIILVSNQGVITDANDHFCRLLDYQRPEVQFKPLSGFIENVEPGTGINQEELQGNTYPRAEKRFIRKDGSIMVMEVYTWTTEDDLTVIQVHDTSEHKPAGENLQTPVTASPGISQTETALRQSEEKYRQIAENTSDVIWVIDKNLNYTYISPSILQQRGFTPQEFMNLSPAEQYTVESYKKVIEIYQTGLQLEKEGKLPHDFTRTVELQHRCKDGSLRDSEVRVRALIDGNGCLAGAHGVSRDITEQKLAREKLRILYEFQSDLLKINGLKEMHDLVVATIFNLINDLFIISTNIEHPAGSGTVISIAGNAEEVKLAIELFGVNPYNIIFNIDEIPEKEMEIFSCGQFMELSGGLYSALLGKFPEEITKNVETRLNIQRTYTIGYLYNGIYLGSLLLLSKKDLSKFTDIINMIVSQASVAFYRMRTELALFESQERFRLAFATSPDAICLIVFETLIFTEINDGFSQFTGYSREEVLGKTAADLSLWYDQEVRKIFLSTLIANGHVTNMEASFRTRDGSVKNAMLSASIFMAQGHNNIILIARNIDDIKQTQRELIRAKEEAVEASQIKTAFLNNISHEVRTPMNAIVGFTELLQTEDFSPLDRARYFTIIQANANQLLNIIDDVLEVSRMDTGGIPLNNIQFSLTDLLEDIHIALNETVLRKGLHFWYKVDKGGDHDFVIADIEKIRQVINGLIGNAVKFTNEGSVSYGCVKKEETLEFYVRDTGVGIAPEHREKIFERFFQVRQDPVAGVHGTGLGLSIVKGLAEMMNGTIRLESTLNVGTTFYLTIPYTKAVFPKKDKVANPPVALEELTILIAEDEHFNFELLELILEKHTGKLIRAANGVEVLAILRKQKPDLILMDLKMPVMDGFEATRRARLIYPDLRIIALTAYSQPDDARRALQAGCNAFISKPVRRQELFDTIHRVLR